MPLPDGDSAVGHYFGLEIDGVMLKEIQEISGLSIEQDVIELKQNTPDGKYSIKKQPGRQKAGSFTVTRGLSSSDSLEKWLTSSLDGKMADARKSGAVIIFDYTGMPIKRYKFEQAWVSKLEIGSLKAGDTSVLTEKATVNYENISASDS